MTPTETRTAVAVGLVYLARMLGLFMLLPVLPLAVAEVPGATPLLLGLALGGYGLFQALLQLPLGLASDHWGRRPVIAFGLALFILGSLVCAWAPDVHWLIAGRCLQGCGALASVLLALVADLTRAEHRAKAMALVGVTIAASFGLSLMLGPLVMAYGGLPALFHLCALLGLVGLAALFILVPPPPAPPHPIPAQAGIQSRGGDLHVTNHDHPIPAQAGIQRADAASPHPTGERSISVATGLLAQVAADPRLWLINLSVFLLHFQFVAVFFLVPALLDQAGVPLAEHSLYYLCLLVLAVLLVLPGLWLSDRLPDIRPLLATLVVLMAASLLLLAASPAFALLLAAALVFLAAFSLMEALLPASVSRLAGAEARGTAMGVYSSCQFAGIFMGGLVSGWLAGLADMSIFSMVNGLLFLLWLAAVLCFPVPGGPAASRRGA